MTESKENTFPFNIEDLIQKGRTEGNRIEFKEKWDKNIKNNTIKTISAFANDFLNLNGGYIVIGIEDDNGTAKLPPVGINIDHLESIQRDIRQACSANIKPEYLPAPFHAEYRSKDLLVLWCPGGDHRPYEVRKDITKKGSDFVHYIRIGPETIIAKGEYKRQLFAMTAKIPFDDRKNINANIDDLNSSLVKRFLRNIGSGLPLDNGLDQDELYRRLRLTIKVNSHEVPKNIGLLFFSEDPDVFFPGARIEIVQFSNEAGDLLEEKIFKGPLNDQIKSVLEYLNSIGGSVLEKIPGQAEVEKTVPYPYEAMEEAIVNAIYHRSYDNVSEPTKIYLYPDRMEVISYPGPVGGIQEKHFSRGASIPPVPARNRRVGEILKDLNLAEGRGTGIHKIRVRMQENGSPEPKFEFDEERTYFRAILPVHPRYQALHAIREADLKWAVGEREYAVTKLRRAFEKIPNSGAIAGKLIGYASEIDDDELVMDTFNQFIKKDFVSENSRPYLSYARHLISNNRNREANEILESMPSYGEKDEKVETAMMKRQAGSLKEAHSLFMELFSEYPDDAKIVHELAQIKNNIAKGERKYPLKKRLTREAVVLLRRAIALSDNTVRSAWCWYDLAKSLDWLNEPKDDVEKAFLKSISLLPDDKRFKEHYERWKHNRKGGETDGSINNPE